MTGLEKLEAEELKLKMYEQAGYRCTVCDKLLQYSEAQLAHKINQGKRNLKKYGSEIIHHRFNMQITCAGCNSAVLIDHKTEAREALIDRILAEIDSKGKK
jgi:hypothetical protein